MKRWEETNQIIVAINRNVNRNKYFGTLRIKSKTPKL